MRKKTTKENKSAQKLPLAQTLINNVLAPSKDVDKLLAFIDSSDFKQLAEATRTIKEWADYLKQHPTLNLELNLDEAVHLRELLGKIIDAPGNKPGNIVAAEIFRKLCLLLGLDLNNRIVAPPTDTPEALNGAVVYVLAEIDNKGTPVWSNSYSHFSDFLDDFAAAEEFTYVGYELHLATGRATLLVSGKGDKTSLTPAYKQLLETLKDEADGDFEDEDESGEI